MVRKLALTIASLALAMPGATHALGLGNISLRSGLNQPLNAEIGLAAVKPSELEDIVVRLASPGAFERAGIDRPFFLTKLRFEVVSGRNGKPYIRVSSHDPIKEPYLDFLVEVNWPNGNLVREYTALVDPPTFARRAPAPIRAPVATAPMEVMPVTQAPVSAPAPVGAPAAPSTPVAGAPPGSYGPTAHGDTAWEIAQQVRPDDSVGVPQTLVALFQANPDAFFANNVNNLKTGRILRVPSRDEIAEVSSNEAAQEITQQYQAWLEYREQATGAAKAPPMTAQAGETAAGAGAKPGEKPTQASKGEVSGQDRLQLVRAMEPESAADVKGTETGGDLEDLRQRLSLALEQVSAKEGENHELQERVSELEGQVDNMQRLISLKDDELARLQRDLQQASSAPAVAALEPAFAEHAVAPVGAPEEAGETLPGGPAEVVPENETPAAPSGGEAGAPAPVGDEAALREIAPALVGREEPAETAAVPAESEEQEPAPSEEQAEAMPAEEVPTKTEAAPELGAEPLVIGTPETQEPAKPEAPPETAAPQGEAVTEQPPMGPITVGEKTPSERAAPVGVHPGYVGEAVSVTPPAPPEPAQPVTPPEPVTPPKPVTPTPPPAPSEVGMLDRLLTSPLALGGLVVVLLGLGGVGYFLKRRLAMQREEFQETIMPHPEATSMEEESTDLDDTASLEAQAQAVDTVALQAGEASDPIAEADVYMAYGRYSQAEDLLKGAIADHPDRNELRVKLLEVYHGAKNSEAFEREAEALRSRLGGTSDPTWDNVASMGIEVCPDSPLFAEHAAPEGDTHSMTMVLTEEEISGAAEGFGEFGQTAAIEPPHAPPGGAQETVLDFGEAAEEPANATAERGRERESPAPPAGEPNEGMDFDLGFLDEGANKGAAETSDQDLGLDFELESEETPSEIKTQTIVASPEEDAGLDLALDFNTEDTADTGKSAEAELDLGLETERPTGTPAREEIGLDLSLGEVQSAEPEAPPVGEDTGMMEGLDFLSEDADEVSTKLDLAKAYIDMGDEESARGILEEVVSDGSAEQMAEAREILGRITH